MAEEKAGVQILKRSPEDLLAIAIIGLRNGLQSVTFAIRDEDGRIYNIQVEEHITEPLSAEKHLN